MKSVSNKANQPKIGVGVFIFKRGKFLMGQRKGEHGTDTWSVPGGYQEFGESWEDASMREAMEETGIRIKNVRFGAITNNIFISEDKHTITIWTISDWESGEPTINEPEKFAHQGWFDFDNLPEPLFLPWRELMVSEFYEDLKLELAKSKK